MYRFSRKAREGSAVYKAPCGKSVLQSNGGNELRDHIENCSFCRNEIEKHHISNKGPGTPQKSL